MILQDLDQRQRALVKLCREVVRPGEARLDLVMQSANFAGLSTALRRESKHSVSPDAKSGSPATCWIEAGKSSVYLGMQDAARRMGTAAASYLSGMRNIIRLLSKTGGVGRPVCVSFDHAGNVPAERLEAIFRAVDDCAYRDAIAVHVILVITRVHTYDFSKRTVCAVWPKENEILKPRWRTFEYGPKSFQLVKHAMKFEPVMEGDEEESETPMFHVKTA